jgi:hypothetical protein
MTRDIRSDAELTEILDRLSSRLISLDDAELLKAIPSATVIRELRSRYSVVFQERSIGAKKELGLCKSIESSPFVNSASDSPNVAFHLVSKLIDCVFLSLYDDRLSELSAIESITVAPSKVADYLIVHLGAGTKLDRTPDQWFVKRLKSQKTELSTEFLNKRGWNLQLILPYLRRSSPE